MYADNCDTLEQNMLLHLFILVFWLMQRLNTNSLELVINVTGSSMKVILYEGHVTLRTYSILIAAYNPDPKVFVKSLLVTARTPSQNRYAMTYIRSQDHTTLCEKLAHRQTLTRFLWSLTRILVSNHSLSLFLLNIYTLHMNGRVLVVMERQN